MKKKELKELEKELTALQIMVKMRLIDMDEFKRVLSEIGNEHKMNIVLRVHNNTTDERTIEYMNCYQ